jgi:hypothetical protein
MEKQNEEVKKVESIAKLKRRTKVSVKYPES